MGQRSADPSRGELDGKWQAIQARTDLAHHGSVRNRDLEVRLDLLRALEEEPHSRRSLQHLQRRQSLVIGQGKRRDRAVHAPPRDAAACGWSPAA